MVCMWKVVEAAFWRRLRAGVSAIGAIVSFLSSTRGRKKPPYLRNPSHRFWTDWMTAIGLSPIDPSPKFATAGTALFQIPGDFHLVEMLFKFDNPHSRPNGEEVPESARKGIQEQAAGSQLRRSLEQSRDTRSSG